MLDAVFGKESKSLHYGVTVKPRFPDTSLSRTVCFVHGERKPLHFSKFKLLNTDILNKRSKADFTVGSIYRKIPKINPGAYVFQRPFARGLFWRGLSTEGNLRFKINWASIIVGRKFTVFALFYFLFEGNFQVQAPRGGLYLEGRFDGGFFALRVWGAYIWRAFYMEGLIFGILRYIFFQKSRSHFTTELQSKPALRTIA